MPQALKVLLEQALSGALPMPDRRLVVPLCALWAKGRLWKALGQQQTVHTHRICPLSEACLEMTPGGLAGGIPGACAGRKGQRV